MYNKFFWTKQCHSTSISIVQDSRPDRSPDWQSLHDSPPPTNLSHNSPARATGLGMRDIALQLVTPELSQLLQHGHAVPEPGGASKVTAAAPSTQASMPEDMLAIQALPSLLTLHPDDVLAPQPLTPTATALWKKGNAAVTASRFVRNVQTGLVPKPGNTDLETPAAAVSKARKKQRKVLPTMFVP